tara:strand:- start:546 stop:1160 length:615 start_codon:yes stop_codon:yes gene_type:complete
MLQNIENTKYEIILYDDGSIDDTVEIAKHFGVKAITGKKNKGVSHARNELLNACKSTFACWMDSDDLSNVYRLNHQYNIIKKRSNIFVASKCQRFNKDQMNIYEPPKKHVNSNNYPFATYMFRMKEAVQFNQKVTLGSEDGLWRREMSIKNELIKLDLILYYVRLHKGNRIGLLKKLKCNQEKKKESQKIVLEEIERINKLKNG